MEEAPPPTEAPLPPVVSWFAPWRWFAHWKPWKRWTVLVVMLFVGYIESPVIVIPLVNHLIDFSPSLRAFDTWIEGGMGIVYAPLGILVTFVPALSELLEVQAEWVESTFTSI